MTDGVGNGCTAELRGLEDFEIRPAVESESQVGRMELRGRHDPLG